jgi:hypothetical protein
LNRNDLAILLGFLAEHYRQYELVIDNDIATKQGVSIVNALEKLAERVSGSAPAERKFRMLDQELSHASIQNDRGENVPFRVFMQLKNKLGLDELDRKHTAAY